MEKNMKKIYFSLMLLATLFVTSCSMDQKPFGALDDQSAIRNEKDLYQFRTSSTAIFAVLLPAVGSTSPTW